MSDQGKKNQPRAAARINARLNRNLNAYIAAAGAAGVGALALTQAAEAKIVYTPANSVVTTPVSIDLNHDGTVDFSVGLYPGYYHTQLLDVTPKVKGNAVNGAAGFFGVPVGPAAKFATNSYFGHGVEMAKLFQYSHSSFTGAWAGVTNRYLGFKFLIDGQVHYGWARMSVSNIHDAVLTGYAYETIPNKTILEGHTSGPEAADNFAPFDLLAPVPQPLSLGMLARGADGLSIWRRDEVSFTR
jgi:hypothetical protein